MAIGHTLNCLTSIMRLKSCWLLMSNMCVLQRNNAMWDIIKSTSLFLHYLSNLQLDLHFLIPKKLMYHTQISYSNLIFIVSHILSSLSRTEIVCMCVLKSNSSAWVAQNSQWLCLWLAPGKLVGIMFQFFQGIHNGFVLDYLDQRHSVHLKLFQEKWNYFVYSSPFVLFFFSIQGIERLKNKIT